MISGVAKKRTFFKGRVPLSGDVLRKKVIGDGGVDGGSSAMGGGAGGIGGSDEGMFLRKYVMVGFLWRGKEGKDGLTVLGWGMGGVPWREESE